MSYLQYGVTYNKNNSGIYKPLTNLLIKTDSVTWTPVQTAWYKRPDGEWERVYPTPRGISTANVTSLTFNTYQFYQSATQQSIQITNTGDYQLTINNFFVNDSIGNYATSHVDTSDSYPVTLAPNQSTVLRLNVFGNTVGTGFTGNVNFTNYIGYLGYANTSIPVTVNVIADYPAISVTPNPINIAFSLFEGNSGLTNVSITNSGIGGNLGVSSIAAFGEPLSFAIINEIAPITIGSNITVNNFQTTYAGNVATFSISPANLNVGNYTGKISITSNAANSSNLIVPVNITVTQPSGLQAFTESGTYTWTVPDHVHQLTVLAVGSGGGGGGALPNGLITSTGQVNQGGSGGGGGSGDFSIQQVTVTPGETLSITIGSVGTNGGLVQDTPWYPVTLSYSWSSFMNSYAVWTNQDGTSPINSVVTSRRIFTAPYTGTYNITYAADDSLTFSIDGTQIFASAGGTFTSSVTVTGVTMSQGNRLLEFDALNTGGPAGFAMTIANSSNTVLWTTRTDLNTYSGTSAGPTVITGSFGNITVAGGAYGTGAYDNYVYPAPDYSGGGGGDGVD